MSTSIRVTAESSNDIAPERATVTLNIGFESAEKSTAHAKTATLVEQIQSEVNQLKASQAQPIVSSSFGQLRTSSWRPVSQNGEPMPLVYSETMAAKVEFSDFVALSEWLAKISTVEGVRVGYISWSLSDETRKKATEQAQQEAIKQARVKAEAYARAIGTTVASVETIADEGLMGSGRQLSRSVDFGSVAGLEQRAKRSDTEKYDLAPADITVTARIEATYLTA